MTPFSKYLWSKWFFHHVMLELIGDFHQSVVLILRASNVMLTNSARQTGTAWLEDTRVNATTKADNDLISPLAP